MKRFILIFSDILKLREIVRKKFLMYYAQENLFDLKARQMAENRIMDDVEQFNEVKKKNKTFDANRRFFFVLAPKKKFKIN